MLFGRHFDQQFMSLCVDMGANFAGTSMLSMCVTSLNCQISVVLQGMANGDPVTSNPKNILGAKFTGSSML